MSLSTITGTIEDSGAAITITANGIAIVGEPSEEIVERTMGEFANAGRSCSFVIGDLINYAATTWGEKYARWIEVTGLEYGTLRNYASTCRSVPMERRREGLSFSHHKEVAALSSDAQERWLGEAEERGMSKARLSASVALGRPATPADMKPAQALALATSELATGATSTPAEPPAIETVHPYVNRLSIFLGKFARSGAYEEMNESQLYNLHRDLMPVMTQHGNLIRQLLRHASDSTRALVMNDMATALRG
jgi:hypothetical protein